MCYGTQTFWFEFWVVLHVDNQIVESHVLKTALILVFVDFNVSQVQFLSAIVYLKMSSGPLCKIAKKLHDLDTICKQVK